MIVNLKSPPRRVCSRRPVDPTTEERETEERDQDGRVGSFVRNDHVKAVAARMNFRFL
jgi:hypothetical protein